MIWVYKEPVHNNPQINNIDNEAHKKIRDDFTGLADMLIAT